MAAHAPHIQGFSEARYKLACSYARDKIRHLNSPSRPGKLSPETRLQISGHRTLDCLRLGQNFLGLNPYRTYILCSIHIKLRRGRNHDILYYVSYLSLSPPSQHPQLPDLKPILGTFTDRYGKFKAYNRHLLVTILESTTGDTTRNTPPVAAGLLYVHVRGPRAEEFSPRRTRLQK